MGDRTGTRQHAALTHDDITNTFHGGQNNEQKIVYIDSGSYVYEKGDNINSYFRFHFIVFKQYNAV